MSDEAALLDPKLDALAIAVAEYGDDMEGVDALLDAADRAHLEFVARVLGQHLAYEVAAHHDLSDWIAQRRALLLANLPQPRGLLSELADWIDREGLPDA